MDNLQKQYQKVRQEEKDLIENTRRKIINNQAKLQEEYQNYQELETLREELEDVDRSLEFFDDLDLVNMWLFDTSIEEAAEYLIENQGWMEVMDIQDQGIVYTDRRNRDIFYCINDERRYMFE